MNFQPCNKRYINNIFQRNRIIVLAIIRRRELYIEYSSSENRQVQPFNPIVIMLQTRSVKQNQPVLQTITLPCSATVNVVCWTPNKQHSAACVLLHGLDNNARVWDPLAQQLSHSFSVYAVDFRGHGESGWGDDSSYNIKQFTEDLEQIRLQLHLDTFYLIGHSLGGRVAVNYCARFNEYVKALVLGDVGPRVNRDFLKKMHQDHLAAPKSFDSSESYINYLKDVYVLADDDVLRHFAKHNLKNKNGIFYNKTDPLCKDTLLTLLNHSDNNHSLFSSNVLELLPSITQHTLIVRGEYSAVLELSQADTMLGKLRNGKVITIDGAGHAIMFDNPTDTVTAIERFLIDVSADQR